MSENRIDLGEMPRGAARAETREPPVPRRSLLAVVSMLLLLTMSAAGATDRPEPPLLLPAARGDTMTVAGDRLFVISGRATSRRTVQAYALPSGRRLFRNTFAVGGEVVNIVDAGDDRMLVTVQNPQSGVFSTIALRGGVPEPLWERPALSHGVSVADGVVVIRQEEVVGAGLTEWHGVDLETGESRWTVHEGLGDDVTLSTWTCGYPQWLYMMTRDGRLQARDTRTGRVTAQVDVPERRSGGVVLWAAGELVMIGAGDQGTTGYDASAGLAPRWRSGLNLTWYRGPTGCGELICAYLPQRGVVVIDARTGLERWSSDRWESAEPVGDYLLAGAPDTAVPALHVLDPATGDVLGQVGPWRSGGPGPEPRTAWVFRAAEGEGRIFYGVLDLPRARVRMLGAAEEAIGDCRFAAGTLVCRRSDYRIGVWRS
ncbi:PQQ-binding-like beta-propeller repeat protein [Actinoplanes sp. NBRC 101535]|uniref:outer membrane protein assembly factor BamB family protein n=1 Tax=Actinoplanes sp. NBRC 101535 TaxID=3032196 RepID=UPI0024A2DA2D|nr:PQQ-binding-like beta-propeller repeat protein [Actinoplanes sp. NBRC 101535]GLY04683.1 hypothetical protein Acsp01_50620 [Actinoplanes sp. NBRC 101535]